MTKIKSFFANHTLQIIAFVIGIICTGFVFLDNLPVAITQVILLIAIAIGSFLHSQISGRRLKKTVQMTSKYLSIKDTKTLEGFPFATAVVNQNGKIVWCNDLFYSQLVESELLVEDNISEFTGGLVIDDIIELGSVEVDTKERRYTVFVNKLVSENNMSMLYFVDETELKNISDEYVLSKPAIMHVAVDNADEILQNYKDSEIAVVNGKIEIIIESWAAKFPCVMRKVSNGRYFIIVEERGLRDMIEEKFKVLEQIREFEYKDKVIGITLSVGVGRGDNMIDADKNARQSLDMAQGRGGDQVGIKSRGEYQFYGGLSSGVEKKTKTKTRIISTALSELIEGSENVLVMGHCYSDLDSIGAAVGVCCIAQSLGKDAKIVLYKEKSLAESLVNYLEQNGKDDLFIQPEKSLEFVHKRTLLVIVDTHRAEFLEYKELYDKVERVVVIDHHRRTVDYIQNAVIFYDEPTSSSASEMVTEIMQYTTDKKFVDSIIAESLLSGIMLDTRNFILRTGVRSFEAAAFLRSRGADTVAVKQLFANSMDNYRQRNAIIGDCTTYKNCAIAVAPENIQNIRIVSSQVADELLNVTGIKSSYVIFKTEDKINISARSMGEMNVQIIMEKLGGGGHQTMSAAQLDEKDVNVCVTKLKEVLDYYFENY